MEKVTSLQVAERAGVSQSAVSRVFTPGASASAKTVEKVKKAAAELGYRPNKVARAMITGKSRIIGLVVAYLDNQFYPLALDLLSSALQEQGYHILVFTAPGSDRGSESGADQVVEELLDYQVDGIITASVGMTSNLASRCASAGIPDVMFNRGQGGDGISAVTSANYTGGRAVADFFLSCGHTRFAHISGWVGSSTGRDRQAGFCDRLAEAGFVPAVADGQYRIDIASQATRDLMAASTPPDAIFAGNDHMAFAVMDTLRFQLGLRVPQDVAVVGYDDVPLAAWPSYGLTTMRQPVNRMVAATVAQLMMQIEDPTAQPRRIEIESPLIERGSTKERQT